MREGTQTAELEKTAVRIAEVFGEDFSLKVVVSRTLVVRAVVVAHFQIGRAHV